MGLDEENDKLVLCTDTGQNLLDVLVVFFCKISNLKKQNWSICPANVAPIVSRENRLPWYIYILVLKEYNLNIGYFVSCLYPVPTREMFLIERCYITWYLVC